MRRIRSSRLSVEMRHRLSLYATKGGKTSRRNTIDRIARFVDWCGRRPEQIGRKQVHEFFRSHNWAPSTARDYYYAICLLWDFLGRPGRPPGPGESRLEN